MENEIPENFNPYLIPEIEPDFYPPCKYCGKEHGHGIKDTKTGVIEALDVCPECFWKSAYSELQVGDEENAIESDVK